jgi:GT2 family glycosyltransferase
MNSKENMTVELSIIIVNYNSAEYVLNCVKTIHEQTTSIRCEIIVVDNASYDACKQKLADGFPDVAFIQSPVNLGFGKANNLGAQHAAGEVLLFLNPDTEIKENALDRLYAVYSALKAPGAVGCRLLNSDGSLQKSCVQPFPTVLNQVLDADALMRLFPTSDLWKNAVLLGEELEPAAVEVISGACIMIGKNVFGRVGGFSPEYFMYAEDLDLCYKTRSLGLVNYYVGAAVVVHHGGGSTNRSGSTFSNVMMRESVFRFLRKTRGCLYASCYRAALSLAALARIGLIILLYPAYCFRGNIGVWPFVFRKWVSVLRWGLGLELWIRKYDFADNVAAYPAG